MTENVQTSLLDYLGENYIALRQRLTRRLGSIELAGDALQDTWLRLRGGAAAEPVRDPGAYLTRMAVNLAIDVQRRHSRMLSGDEVDELLQDLADPAPGPEHVVEVGSELESLLERLPERRRAVALLVHGEGITQKEAAERLGVSLRTVEYELQRFHERMQARRTRAG